jgi:hypothetical protein
MKTSTSVLLPAGIAIICALGGCEWIAGIQDTTLSLDAALPAADAALPALDAARPIPDGGGDSPDALGDCMMPCLDDNAFNDFGGSQGGANGRWRYVEVQPEPDSYVAMSLATFPGAVTGFMGTGSPAPSLAYCTSPATSPPCFELLGALALTTTAPGSHHPALLWTAPEAGYYVVVAYYRVSSDAPAVATTMMLTHNSQSNVLESDTLTITTETSQMYAEVSVLAGDTIVLSAIATTEQSVSVGANFYITGPY